MPLMERVRRHPWISSSVAVTALAALGACGAGLAGPKVATSPGYDASAPSARGGDRYEGPSAAAEPISEPMTDRPGLGTSWGESVTSRISFTSFVRSSPAPWAEVVFHYNDVAGVAAHAEYLGARPAPLELPAGDGALSVALVDCDGRKLP
jgi:hypothetical protein